MLDTKFNDQLNLRKSKTSFFILNKNIFKLSLITEYVNHSMYPQLIYILSHT